MTQSKNPSDADRMFAIQRRELVDQLAQSGITDQRVLAAMDRVPRERFVSDDEQSVAYSNRALPIDCDQTISQPYTVAFMCEALRLTGNERVLEIGTGSGYNAAILSLLAAEVFTIERYAALANEATGRLHALRYRNVHVFTGDGTLGWPDAAPYDAIIVTAAAKAMPQAYIDQLAEEGRVVIPIGPTYEGQRMSRFTKRHGAVVEEFLGMFRFVPLIGEYGWPNGEKEDR